MSLNEEYDRLCAIPSDINEHLPALRALAAQCDHVTEMGVRGGCSTIALACGYPGRMISYDVNPIPAAVKAMIEQEVDFTFIQADVREIEIMPTDLLFIDTLHTYTQLSAELKRHARDALKFIVFHDTVTFGTHGEDGKTPSLRQAIIDNLDQTHWKMRDDYRNNNGLMVMERKA